MWWCMLQSPGGATYFAPRGWGVCHLCRGTYSRFEPIVAVTTRPDRRELTHDRLLAQSTVIKEDSTGESGRELLVNQNIRNEAWSFREKIELTFTEHSRIF